MRVHEGRQRSMNKRGRTGKKRETTRNSQREGPEGEMTKIKREVLG